MYQKLIIVGNLGKDPELRHTGDSTPVCNFSVATSRRWNNSAGESQETTTWFRVTCWRRIAEVANEYLAKGRRVLVEGELKPDDNGGPRIWVGNDGTPRASFEMTAQVIKFLSSRGEVEGQATSDDGPPPQEDKGSIPF